jgi:hypothetical protein
MGRSSKVALLSWHHCIFGGVRIGSRCIWNLALQFCRLRSSVGLSDLPRPKYARRVWPVLTYFVEWGWS